MNDRAKASYELQMDVLAKVSKRVVRDEQLIRRQRELEMRLEILEKQ